MTAKTSILVFLASLRLAAGQMVPEPTETIALTSASPYTATGELYVSKADPHALELRNPVLVVEGFDANNTMGWEMLYELINQEHLIEDLHRYGRDLLILNFGDSTEDILANSALTESAIDYIQAHRHDTTDKFTVVGVSLGGLTVRKALADMPDHDVDTWVSFDAPHEGANIPLGLQEYFEYFSTITLSDFDPVRAYLAILDRPATKQMLIAHHGHSPDAPAGGSSPEREGFIAAMNAAGYPAHCKGIAISNGSGFGEKLPFDSGDLVIHWHYDGPVFFGPDIDSDIYALPKSTSSTVFYGRFAALVGSAPAKTVYSYAPYALDNAPGGYRPSFYEFFTNLPPDKIDGDDYCNTTNHCFIPTVSALGIPIGNIESNLASHAEIAALSPFDEIHYALTNERHVEINAHNKRWLLRAALEGRDTDGDGLDDYQEYFVGTAYDTPDNTLALGIAMEIQMPNGTAALSWEIFPNTQYEVWFSETLGSPWTWLETIPPSTAPDILHRDYAIDSGVLSGFFRIVATPIDPVTD